MDRRDLLLVVAAFAAGCAGVDPSTKSASGKLIEDLDPAAFVVAIGPVDAAAARSGDSALALTLDGPALRERIVDAMVRLRAATRIVTADSLEDARSRGVDVFVSPKLTSAHLSYKEVSDQWWSSGLLWVVTWFGGLAVRSSTYDTHVAFDCAFTNPESSDRTQCASWSGRSDAIDLTFWDRNDAFSWPFFQSLVLPPFWTTDQADVTSATLSDRAVFAAAARLTAFVKEDLEQQGRRQLGQLVHVEPANGSTVGSGIDLSATLTAPERLTSLQIELNDASTPVAELGDADLRRAERPFGDGFEYVIERRIDGLAPGENLVRIRFLIAGQQARRTLHFVQGSGTRVGNGQN